MRGKDGADFIFCGLGNDKIHGGTGADVFLFNQGSGIDRDFDFTDVGRAADDRIMIQQSGYDRMAKSDDADGVHLFIGNGAMLILRNHVARISGWMTLCLCDQALRVRADLILATPMLCALR